MKKPIIRIHNIETDEVIDREMTDAEFAEYEAQQAAELRRKIDEEAKVAARQSVLERLGLTEDEAKLLLG